MPHQINGRCQGRRYCHQQGPAMAGVFGSGSHARSKEKPPELSPGGFVSDVDIAR